MPGTRCNLDAAVPYCSSPGDARDDRANVARSSSDNILDVLANDSRSESSCRDGAFAVLSVTGTGAASSTATTAEGGTASVGPDGADVTYTPPSDRCGFIDTFKYTADLGGGVQDSATVRVLVKCVCSDGMLDAASSATSARPTARCRPAAAAPAPSTSCAAT